MTKGEVVHVCENMKSPGCGDVCEVGKVHVKKLVCLRLCDTIVLIGKGVRDWGSGWYVWKDSWKKYLVHF